MRFATRDTPLSGLRLIERIPIRDDRGHLVRLFCSRELASMGWDKPIAQINHTLTRRKGTVRGMHFQCPPHAEAKLVSCVRGAVWDVGIDLRAGSPTFLQWHAELLSAENQCALLIPEGFAHGFQTMAEDCELLYLHSVAYAAESEGAVNATDPRVGITWPLSITEQSARDRSHPLLANDFNGLTL